MSLRLLSYLAPSVPASLFEALAAALATEVEVRFRSSRSGPRPGEDEPFTHGD